MPCGVCGGILQDDLFVRAGSKMLSTPFAEQIYPAIQNALAAIQGISMQKRRFDPSMVQSLKIAVHDEIEPIIFPKLVAHFQRLDLTIQFFSIKLERKSIAADLAAQQIDFVIDLGRTSAKKFSFRSCLQDQFCGLHPAESDD